MVYYDRPYRPGSGLHYIHLYYDRYHRPYTSMIWPLFNFRVYYGHGPSYRFCTVYPYYLRKYVFVSLGGYWPSAGVGLRYYWYGWHPYDWYGYDPVPYQVNNTYTYNYYYEDGASTQIVDSRQILTELPAPPPQGPADACFSQGVDAFEKQQYGVAANLFRQTMQNAPTDIVAPFAYAQALFADGEYWLAAMALRKAIDQVDPANNTIFYPRGLYTDDDVLFGQVDHLADAAEQNPTDYDLKLLLGYHLLGVGQVDQANGYLEQAARDWQNARAAGRLLDLIRKIQTKDPSGAGLP